MKYTQLNIEEREIIQQMLWDKESIRNIAKKLSRSASTISREVNKNSSKDRNRYTPRLANERAQTKRKSRGRKDRLKTEEIRNEVHKLLDLRWSPEQISNHIRIEKELKISHEAIYQYIYEKAPELRIKLRRQRKIRQPHNSRRYQRLVNTSGISIDSRPKVVETRKRLGDFESDTVESVNHLPGINTIVDRKSRYLFVNKLESKKSVDTSEAVLYTLGMLKSKYIHTITFDNGKENQNYKYIEANSNIKCYFAHPYHSWERGTNENTNGLIRDFFPKKTNFVTIDNVELQHVANLLNHRPRKCLGWKTPSQVMSVALRG